MSLAGRTTEIVDQGVPVRLGGFGGAAGLADHLRRERVDILVDATHPFAEVISANAVAAARATATPLLALRRPAWRPMPGDDWIEVATMAAAAAALGETPRRAFLAIGSREMAPFARFPWHFYLVRSVEPVPPSAALPQAVHVVARGPFAEADDLALMQAHAIEVLVCRNSGGTAGHGKVAAARRLGLPVVMVAMPAGATAATVDTVAAALAWIDQRLAAAAVRGV